MKKTIYISTLVLCIFIGVLIALGSTISQGFLNLGGAAAGGLSVSGYYLYDGTNYYTGPANQIATLPLSATYSWVNQSLATETASGNALVLHSGVPDASTNLNLRIVNIGSATTLTTAIICDSLSGGSAPSVCGVGFYESSTGKIVTMEIGATSNTQWAIQVNRFFSTTGFASNQFNSGVPGLPSVVWTKLTISGGNISFSYSTDGVNFPIGYTEAANAFFTTAPNQWFYMVDAEGAPQDVYATLLSWVAH
jgi:hypothetical protein